MGLPVTEQPQVAPEISHHQPQVLCETLGPSWAVSLPSPTLTLPGPVLWLNNQHCPKLGKPSSCGKQPTLCLGGPGDSGRTTHIAMHLPYSVGGCSPTRVVMGQLESPRWWSQEVWNRTPSFSACPALFLSLNLCRLHNWSGSEETHSWPRGLPRGK